ncbi:MAG: metallophosphoesterase, partial [Ferruginibacter sp.]
MIVFTKIPDKGDEYLMQKKVRRQKPASLLPRLMMGLLLFIGLMAFNQNVSAQLAKGDLAFTSFNADEDGWSLTTFVDIPANTVIYFTDNEAQSTTSFNSGESYHQWNTGAAIISAGTVIRFSAIDNATALAASVGAFTRLSVALNTNYGLSTGAETVYAYLATSSTPTAPVTMLAAISNDESPTLTDLSNAGLTDGVNAIVLTSAASGPDYGEYNGSRSNQTTFAGYRPLVNNVANWTVDAIDGSYATTVPNTTAFTIISCTSPGQPGAFNAKTTFVYQSDNAVAYTVPNTPGVTYTWSYTGTGATINGTTNSVTVNYSAIATSGTLSVIANNACGMSAPRTLSIGVNAPIVLNTTNYDYSFVTVGCNRVDYLDTAFTTSDPDYSTGASTANVYQLKRLFTEISHLNPLPKYLFMTGDIVMGYINDTIALEKQLTSWRAIYESHPLSSTSIQLVAIPGNHETQDKAAGKKSFVAAERTFQRVMDPYIRGNNGPGVGGLDNLTTDQSKLTYSFNNGGDHFIVLNTDPVGADNTVPYKWLASDIQNARANNARHIFTFGHKPAYSSPLTPNGGLDAVATTPQRDSLWKYLEDNNCEAMFSAHEHLWDSIHPHAGKTWQVIAGNGGSRVEPAWATPGNQYYGYTLVNLYNDKKVNVMGLGRNTDMSTTVGTPFTINEDANPTTVRNSFDICLTTSSATNISACNSYTWNSTVYNASGVYTYNTVNAAGCDSVATLNLTINGSNTGDTTVFACGSFTWYGATFTTTPTITPTHVFTNAFGCDSIVSLHLTVSMCGITGPSSSQSPYVQSVEPSIKFTAILSANDSIGGYPMVG